MDSDPLHFQPAPLVVDDPWDHAKSFFTTDGSVKYDKYIASGVSPPNRIVIEDVVEINRSMSGRSKHESWLRLTQKEHDLPELSAIDPAWDLVELSDEDWDDHDLPHLLESLFDAVIGPDIWISRASKVLHIKRPRLIPVCDSYVLQLLGIPGQSSASGVAACIQLRHECRSHLDRFRSLQTRLREECGLDRSMVRIADVLIWGSHPDTWVARRDQRRRRGPAPD